MSNAEKRRGSKHPENLMYGFTEVDVECSLREAKMLGHPFTWERSRGLSNWVEEKLNKALAQEKWLHLFPPEHVLNEDTTASDNSAIIPLPEKIKPKMSKRFRLRSLGSWKKSARH